MRTEFACRFCLAFLVLACSMNSHAARFVVEEASLQPVPSEVLAGIALHEKSMPTDVQGRPCKFAGKTVALRDGGAAEGWVVTTTDACAWAASAAPVWVLAASKDKRYRVVLFDVTYTLTVGSASRHGLRNISTFRATATRQELRWWKFDGTAYRASP